MECLSFLNSFFKLTNVPAMDPPPSVSELSDEDAEEERVSDRENIEMEAEVRTFTK